MMFILAATIVATESAQLRDAARARLQAEDETARAGTVEDLLAALAPLRAMVAEAARRQADRLSPDELIELQTTLHQILAELLARALGQWLAQHTQALTAAAQRDPLTGLLNRAAFEQRLQDEVVRARRYHHPLALFDIDHLKLINDRRGHPAGDEALRLVARVLQSSLRQSDAVFRYGGDDFATLCPETPRPAMMPVRIRLEENLRAVADSPAEAALGVSWGWAAWPADAQEAAELLRVADARVYACKHEHHQRAARARVEVTAK